MTDVGGRQASASDMTGNFLKNDPFQKMFKITEIFMFSGSKMHLGMS